jgi:predicted dehydrogenase
VIGDTGSHALDLARYLVGDVAELLTTSRTVLPAGPGSIDDEADLLLRFADGATGHIWASWLATGIPMDLGFTVMGDRVTTNPTIFHAAEPGTAGRGRPRVGRTTLEATREVTPAKNRLFKKVHIPSDLRSHLGESNARPTHYEAVAPIPWALYQHREHHPRHRGHVANLANAIGHGRTHASAEA